MISLDLTSEERDLLMELLTNESEEMPAEIRRTETPSFRDELKERRSLLESVLAKVRSLSDEGSARRVSI